MPSEAILTVNLAVAYVAVPRSLGAGGPIRPGALENPPELIWGATSSVSSSIVGTGGQHLPHPSECALTADRRGRLVKLGGNLTRCLPEQEHLADQRVLWVGMRRGRCREK